MNVNQSTPSLTSFDFGVDWERHVIYVPPEGWNYLKHKANQFGVVTDLHRVPSVSAMMRLVCSGHLRIVRSNRFYAIDEDMAKLIGVDRRNLLERGL